MTRAEWLVKNHDKVREYARAYYRRHRDKVLAKHHARYARWTDQRRNDQYKCLYGITVAEYETMKFLQRGCCKLCGQPPKNHRLHIDHDHKSGKVRGLLCNLCNALLVGRLEKYPELYRKIGAYLDL